MKNIFFRIISNQVEESFANGKKKGEDKAKKKYQTLLEQEKKELKESYEYKLQKTKKEYQQNLIQKNHRIKKLIAQINDNRNSYAELRKRENDLDIMSQDIENITNSMTIRIQEAAQPFLKFMAKVENIKRVSDKKDQKISKIFELSI